METRDAYNRWAEIYDTNKNKTRDTEAQALKQTLQNLDFNTCLEIGCGTGKNTQWLGAKAKEVAAVDFSEEMVERARRKIHSETVHFHIADITRQWNFVTVPFDLVTFSLVLEHIENLDFIFSQAALSLKTGGYCYIGELHPFRQYMGTKARFESESGTEILTCFTHNISDFLQPAKKYGFKIADINEHYHPHEKEPVPRILTLLLQKPGS